MADIYVLISQCVTSIFRCDIIAVFAVSSKTPMTLAAPRINRRVVIVVGEARLRATFDAVVSEWKISADVELAIVIPNSFHVPRDAFRDVFGRASHARSMRIPRAAPLRRCFANKSLPQAAMQR